jgi:hypothetical protein
MRLGTKQNWYQLFQELIQDFNVDDVDKRQQEIFKRERIDPSH